jgi:aconitate hydratase
MGAELGATTSMFPADGHMSEYLRATRREGLAQLLERYRDLLQPDAEAEANPHEYYDRVLELDLSTLEPHVVGPHSPDRARPISRLAGEIWSNGDAFCDEISAALIGSCTNSSYEDMSRAADVAEQAARHGLHAKTPFMVTPGSEQIRATIARDGQMRSLEAIGGSVLANACGPCIGQWRRDRVANKPNTIVTSYNRNFPGRNDGLAKTMNFIASPEIVTALAIAGRLSFNPLTDPLVGKDGNEFRLSPPKRAPEVPSAGFDPGRSAYVAPPASGADIALRIDPKSERLQVMEPWPAWNRENFLSMPVLMKTRGKTTTDHISPAGPWLKLRGHLDRFSENLLMGATNAFTGEAGKGRNVLSGESSQPIAKIARDYKARGVRWLIIGDSNYGEGSSREHAALSPRLLGGAVVIARSFARIHETNLKKQGLLALTFTDPADYERIGESDRVDVVNLGDLAPGKPVECNVHHPDGTTEMLTLKHSYGESQLAWFRAGSALNVVPRFNVRVD